MIKEEKWIKRAKKISFYIECISFINLVKNTVGSNSPDDQAGLYFQLFPGRVAKTKDKNSIKEKVRQPGFLMNSR
jgi:hypothetical protein